MVYSKKPIDILADSGKNKSPQEIPSIDGRIPFQARVTKLMESDLKISADEMIGYIDAIISFLEDVTEYHFGEDSSSKDSLSLEDQTEYLHEVFKEVESRTGFLNTELRFIWMQINHLIQPFRNIKTAYEAMKYLPKQKEKFDEEIEYYIDRIHFYKNDIVGKLQVYRDLLSQSETSRIDGQEIGKKFQEIFAEKDVVVDIHGNEENSYQMSRISFQVIFDNLVSNYQKYGKNGKLILSFGNTGILNISFENSYKDESETQGVLSSQVGNLLVLALVKEIYGGDMRVERNPETYRVEITGIQLSKKKNIYL